MQSIRNRYSRIIGWLTVLFLFALCTYTISLQIERHQFRKEVKNMVRNNTPKEDLTVLSFTVEAAKKLEWEHQKEFRYNDKMYDVISAEYKNGYLIYYCWKDDVENDLVIQINSLYTYLLGTDQQEQNKKEHLTKLGHSLICQEIEQISVGDYANSNRQVFSLEKCWKAFTPSTLSPPPELG